ncbi:MAG: hypothetical protein CSB55_00640 [Candidatus Cloacimonadota bacterium]|nr:MAG: hypothetical protein CSB55_00640 [Candidatus Cloacimonadota bacterium]
MKKILVVSDSHAGKLLYPVLDYHADADCIFHLGDYYHDTDDFEAVYPEKKVIKVPGLYCEEYFDRDIRIKTVEIDGITFVLTHSVDDVDPLKYKDSVICFGHTHHPAFIRSDTNIFVNPGHLKQKFHRNAYASCLLIEIRKNSLLFNWFDLYGKIFKSEEASLCFG